MRKRVGEKKVVPFPPIFSSGERDGWKGNFRKRHVTTFSFALTVTTPKRETSWRWRLSEEGLVEL